MTELYITDAALAASLLPKREQNTSKGSFGRAALITGSERYVGAAMLALEAALRGGAGYIDFLGSAALCESLRMRFPEAIYTLLDYTVDSGREALVAQTSRAGAILVGSGCESTEALYLAVAELLSTDGAPVVLDADAINAISSYGNTNIIRNSHRRVILTPHPLEFSRLTGYTVEEIQSDRLTLARDFAASHGCILVLKGSGTVITDGDISYVNSSGSSALAKAGSGDVLAGLLTSLLAFSTDALKTAALAVYIHGRAGDNLAVELSEFGVTPSDLPRECARVIAELSK